MYTILLTLAILICFPGGISMDKIDYVDTFHVIIESVSKSKINSNVDPLLIASIGLVESHYNPDALSSKGAMGVFQFTNIAIKHIEQMGYSFNPRDVRDAAIAAEIYFSYLLKHTSCVEEALIAWNMGITATMKLKLDEKDVDYTSVADMMSKGVYRESANFVIKVMRAYKSIQEIYTKYAESIIWWVTNR